MKDNETQAKITYYFKPQVKGKKTDRQNDRPRLISQDVIDAINKISPETLLAKGVIEKARIGFICPLCGNGKGKDHRHNSACRRFARWLALPRMHREL